MKTTVFLDLFHKALNRVEGSYYSTKPGSLYPNTTKYYERVFCYELHHQVRILMDEQRGKDPTSFSSNQFQGELRKERIGPFIAKQSELFPLDKNYVPDFLLHSPGSAQSHILIVEVKSNPNICFDPIQKDLLKIQKFITQYKYQMGLFLIVNNSRDRMSRLIAKSQSQQWIRVNLADRSRILFLSKENYQKDPFECYLDNVLGETF